MPPAKKLADYIKVQDSTLAGFTARNLWRMKQFYETYRENEKLSALLRELTWTNYLLILSLSKSDEEREFYLNLCSKQKYSVRELEKPTIIADYETKFIPKRLLQNKLNEFYGLIEADKDK